MFSALTQPNSYLFICRFIDQQQQQQHLPIVGESIEPLKSHLSDDQQKQVVSQSKVNKFSKTFEHFEIILL